MKILKRILIGAGIVILLVLAVTSGILVLVNRKSSTDKDGTDEATDSNEAEESQSEPAAADEASKNL